MSDRDQILMKAIAEAVNTRMSQIQPRVRDVTISGKDIAPPVVYNDVQTPEVTVYPPEVNVTNDVKTPEVTINIDLSPLVGAVESLTATLVQKFEAMHEAMEACQKSQEEAMDKMAEWLAKRPPIEFNPVINVPQAKIEFKPEIKVQPAPVEVKMPAKTPKPRIKIERDSEGNLKALSPEE